MDYNAFISFQPYKAPPFFGSACLPDHEGDPMKMHATPVLDLMQGKGREELLNEIATKNRNGPGGDKDDETRRALLSTLTPEEQEFYAKFRNRGVYCAFSGWEGGEYYNIHNHAIVYATIPLNKSSASLYRSISDTKYHGTRRGDFLDKIGIYFYRYNKTFRKELEYFRILAKHAKIVSVKQTIPDVKDPASARLPHLLEIGFVYQYVLWLHQDGYIFHDIRNDKVYDLPDRRDDFSEKEEDQQSVIEELPPFTVNFRKITMEVPEKGFEVNKPFKTKVDAIMSRKLDSAERKMGYIGCTLESTYRKKTVDLNATAEANLCSTDGSVTVSFSKLLPHPDWKNDPADPPQYRVRVENKHAPGLYGYSEWVTVPKAEKKTPVISWIFDCHMHINSGHGAPLPLSRAKVPAPFSNHYSQGMLDTLGATIGRPVLHRFGQLQKEPTDALGALALNESQEIVDSPKLKFMGDSGKRKRLMVCLPMNMDYAHYRGYEGRPVYETKDGKTVYWSEEEKKYCSISPDNKLQWEDYPKQLRKTKEIFYTAKGALVPFYHYDPRAHLKNWREPFVKNLVQTANLSNFPANLPAMGLKMYTALGYRPMDPNIKFPWQEYYSYVSANKIPIICHCSRGGMTTHDILRYYEHEFPKAANAPLNYKTSWFLNEFVSPQAWEKVLKGSPELYLCLAHFGGDSFWEEGDKLHSAPSEVYWRDLDDLDPNNWIAWFLHLMKTYTNFYVDLSYFMSRTIKVEYFKKALLYHPEVKKRLLFGTDWWMYTMEHGYGTSSYLQYVDKFSSMVLSIDDKKFLEKAEVKNPEELLAYFMVLNPMRFLQLKTMIPKLAAAFSRNPEAKRYGWIFEPKDWIQFVPETIEDFYR